MTLGLLRKNYEILQVANITLSNTFLFLAYFPRYWGRAKGVPWNSIRGPLAHNQPHDPGDAKPACVAARAVVWWPLIEGALGNANGLGAFYRLGATSIL